MKQNWQWTIVFVTGFRMFLQAILLERDAYGACWLAPIGGFLIALPVIWLIARKWTLQGNIPKQNPLIRAIALIYLLADTAQMVLLFQEGTKFASLSSYPTTVLYLLLLLFSLFVIRQSRSGVFGLGAALKMVLVLCMAALLLFRVPDAHIVHLTPVLGAGAKQLLLSSLSLAGYGFAFLIWLSGAPDFSPKTGPIIGMWATACGGGAIFAAMEVMLSPVTPGEPAGLYLAVGRLLTSGRSQTSLQLVLYMAWFALLFIAVCLNLKCMAILLSDMLRKDEKLPIPLAVVIATTALAICAEQMMGDNLGMFLDSPGALRSLFLLPLLLALIPHRRAVAA